MKLSPNTADIVSIAEAAERAGADALVVANTMPAMRIDVATRMPRLANVTGGLSGRALMPINLALVWKVAERVRVPVIGSGGVSSTEDTLEYLMAGATAVQVGTALFADPGLPAAIDRGLRQDMERHGYNTVDRYVGLAREGVRRCREEITAG